MPPQGTHGLSLFTFKLAGAGGTWVKLTSNASASFYDANEDQSTDHVNWHVEIDGGDEEMKLRCSEDELRYIFVPRERRMTFAANGKVFALYWASAEAARSFMEQLGDNIFCNRYQFDIHDEERRAALADEVAAQGGGYVPAPGAPALGPMDEDAASDYQDANEAADWAEKQQQQQDAEGSEPATPRTAKRVIGPNWLAEDAPTPAATPYHALIMGAGANTFALRGGVFDVVRNAVGSVTDVGTSFQFRDGRGLVTPSSSSRVLLADREQAMNLLVPGQHGQLRRANIETQQVVATWDFEHAGAAFSVTDMAHDTKSAQMEARSTFLSFNPKHISRWDIRTKEGAVQTLDYDSGRQYAKPPKFTCIATTGAGHTAAGSGDGRIRLYKGDRMDRDACTMVAGLGAPITAIDVTYNGKWVLATTDKYLMLVKTTPADDREGKDAFSRKLGSKLPPPRLLRLRPEDSMRLRGAPLVKAKFTWVTEAGVDERWIVAGAGSATILWRFSKARGPADSVDPSGLAACTDYLLRTNDAGSSVVDAAFLHHRYAPLPAGGDSGSDVEPEGLVMATQSGLYAM